MFRLKNLLAFNTGLTSFKTRIENYVFKQSFLNNITFHVFNASNHI